MTTESATNRIDLDRLSAALTAAGWNPDTDYPHVKTWSHNYREIWANADLVEIWHEDESGNVVSLELPDPIWQHALDLIRAHTTPTPARSHDDAGTPGEEE